MRTICSLVWLCLIGQPVLQAQNLVPNAGFEQAVSWPESEAQFARVLGWSSPSGPFDAYPYATPDYLHRMGSHQARLPDSFFGQILPYKGQAIAGITVYSTVIRDFREYLTARLTRPLEPGREYVVSFYVSNGQANRYGGLAVNGLGFYCSHEPPVQQQHEALPIKAQGIVAQPVFSDKWQKIAFRFIPEEPFRYLTIGNFLPDQEIRSEVVDEQASRFAYYFVDEVSIAPIEQWDSAKARRLDFDVGRMDPVAVLPADAAQRDTEVQQRLTVRSTDIQVKVWDARHVDGDSISLFLNGQAVLSSYLIAAKPRSLRLSLQPGTPNRLLLFAHNLGSSPPNTAALSFYDGVTEHKILLRSDLRQSGVVELVYEP